MKETRLIFLLALCLVSVLRCSAWSCRHVSKLDACNYCCNPNNYSFTYQPQVIEGQCSCSKEDETAIYASLRGDDHGEIFQQIWDSAQPRPGECLHHLDDEQCEACCRAPVGVALNFFPGVYGISNKKCLCTTKDMELYGEPEKPDSRLRSSFLSDEEINNFQKQLEETETLKREQAETDKRAKIDASLGRDNQGEISQQNWDSARPRPGECLHHLDNDQCVACCRPPVGVGLNFFPGVYGKSIKKCLCTARDKELYGEPEEPKGVQENSGLSNEGINNFQKQLEETETLKREQAEADKRAKIEANKPRIKKVKFNGALETLSEGNESDEASEGVVLPPKPRKPDRRDILVGLSGIITVLEKLEESYNDGFTDLRVEELVEAYDQYQKLTENEKNALRSMPLPRLVIDFAIAPVQLENPPPLSSIKEQYRMFRRCHVMGMQHKEGERKEIWDTSSVWALYRKITSMPHEPVEYSEFETAKNESLAKLERMNELTEKSLIYDNLKELAELTYYFNTNLLKPFFIHIFPAMNTVQDVEVLELMYFEHITLYGWRFNITGGYDALPNSDSKEAGFMHVV